MKRNKEKARAMRSGVSPYHKHGKTPYRYSPAITAWERDNGRRIAREENVNPRERNNA